MKVSSGIVVGIIYIEGTNLLAPKATIDENGNINTQGTFSSGGTLTAPNIYTKTEVNQLLDQKHPLLAAASNLARNKLISTYWEPPAGGDTVNTRTNTVVFGATQWLSASARRTRYRLIADCQSGQVIR